MDDEYINMQIAHIKKEIKITKDYMSSENNEYQLQYLKIRYEYLNNVLRYLNSIRPTEEPSQVIPPNMMFTIEEIEQNYNGENGKPAYVIVDNIVFDVSDIGAWAGGTHHGLYAGYDLSKEFNTCHSSMIEMFKNMAPIVGYTVQNQE